MPKPKDDTGNLEVDDLQCCYRAYEYNREMAPRRLIPNPREHRRAAQRRHQDQCFHRDLPPSGAVCSAFGRGEALPPASRRLRQRAAVGQRNRLIEVACGVRLLMGRISFVERYCFFIPGKCFPRGPM